MQLFDLSQQVAVVIGGTGVLGGAMARALASAGARVAVLGRNQERGEACVTQILADNGHAAFFPVDAHDRASIEAAAKAITDHWGVPDVLINGAGGNQPAATVTPDQAFEALPPDAWQTNLDLNLIAGAVLPCQVFGPLMLRARRGSIINIASASAHHPISRVPVYSAAKAAVVNLTQFLAREWAPHGIRVNSISPGFFPAEQNRRLLFEEDGTPTPRARSILAHTPMARFGESHELGGAVVFLASHAASSFVTGSDLVVDGGFLSFTI